MTEDFDWVEFGPDEGSHDADFHFASRHSPTLKYKQITKKNGTISEGLDEFSEEERMEVLGYESISIFRDVMEYIEEFAIYVLSQVDPSRGFVDSMTRVQPSEVKGFLEKIRDERFEEVVDDNSKYDSFDHFLKEYFGYSAYLDRGGNIEDLGDNLAVDSKEAAVEESIESIKDKLGRISWFFLYFSDAYNAVKHGNRVSISESSNFRLESDDGEYYEIDIDEPIADFLCKASGDEMGGRRYIFTAPAHQLREIAIETADETRDLFRPLYDISHVIRKSEMGEYEEGEEWTIDLTFFGIQEDSRNSSKEYTKIENPNSSLWIPSELVPDEMTQDEQGVKRTFYAAFKERSGNLIIETEGDNDPSFDYPIGVEGETSSDEDHMLKWQAELNFEFRISTLPLWQYKELLEMKDESPFSSFEIRIPNEDISRSAQPNKPMDTPDLDKPEYWDLLEFAWQVGLAADVELLYPVFLYEEAAEVLEEYKSRDLTREVAEECLQNLAVETRDCIYTEVSAALLNPDKRVEKGYENLDANLVRSVPGVYNFVLEDGEITDISIEDSYTGEFERQDPGTTDFHGVVLFEEEEAKVYEEISENGLEAIGELSTTGAPENANSCVTVIRQHGIATHWYWFDRVNIAVYPRIPESLIQDVEGLFSRN